MWIFPQYALGHLFAQVHILKQVPEHFPANKQQFRWQTHEATPKDTSTAQLAQHTARRNCNAQPSYSKPLGVSQTRSHQPTCTTPATLAVVRSLPFSWLSGVPRQTIYLKRSPRFFPRIEHTTSLCTEQAHTAHSAPQKK